MKNIKELEAWSYPRRDGYNRCRKDVLGLIDELTEVYNYLDKDELKARIKG